MSENLLPEPDQFEDGPAGLRDAYGRSHARVRELEQEVAGLKGELGTVRIAEAGFPKGSPGFRVIQDFYQGDTTDAKAVTDFAATYGHEPAGGDVIETPDSQRRTAERRADAVRSDPRSRPALQSNDREAELLSQIEAAESEGRYTDSIPLKTQLSDLRRRSGD